MPSTTESTRWRIWTGLATAGTLAAFVVVHGVLPGALVASVVYLFAWLVAYVFDNGYPRSLGQRRTLLVGVGSALVMVYALVVAAEILLGLLTVVVFALVVWLTSPTGPLARRG